MKPSALRHTIFKCLPIRAMQTLALGACLATFNVAYAADTVALTETQKDEIKCGPVQKDPDTGETYQECYQNTTGAYSATIKLTESTFTNNESLFTDIDADSLIGITIGEFSFADALSAASKKKLTASTVEGTWLQTHEVCTKYDADEECVKTKLVTDTTFKISRVKNKGATITVTGKSDNDGNGQKMYTSLCLDNGPGTTTDNAVLSVAGVDINVGLQISCTLKETVADEDGAKGGPYDLTNMTIKAKLAPTACNI
ncbi:MAG: hypothetical protein NTV43_15675 [Methylococcales bacterium]|nr:hypothetical protein [Methylococcales bacterium]